MHFETTLPPVSSTGYKPVSHVECKVPQGSTRFYKVPRGSTRVYKVLQGSTGLHKGPLGLGNERGALAFRRTSVLG